MNTCNSIIGGALTGEAGSLQQATAPTSPILCRIRSISGKTGLLVGALLLGTFETSRCATLFQAVQDALDSATLGTNAVNGVSITTEPVSVTNLLGSTVVLSVAGAGPGLQYQWSLNGYNIWGATNATLTLANLTTDKCGAYRAIIYNGVDTDWSTLAYVQPLVTSLGMADNFTNRTAITGLAGLGGGTTLGATKETADPKPASGNIFQSVWLKWVAPASGPVEMNTLGSGVDTWLGVYTGTVQSNLVAVATDDDGADFGTSSVEFNAQMGITYQIMIATRDYRNAPILFAWNQAPSVSPLPNITAAPTNITTTAGSPAALTVQYQSSVPATVQWYHNDQLMPGATQNTLQWTQLSVADLGTYQAVLNSTQWTYQLPTVEIQFNSEGLSTVGARKKLADAVGSALIGK